MYKEANEKKSELQNHSHTKSLVCANISAPGLGEARTEVLGNEALYGEV